MTTAAEEEDQEEGGDGDDDSKERWVKATTRNLLSMQVETIFHPQYDVIHAGQFKTYRPFCNFQVKNNGKQVPLFVHPQMVHDAQLRLWLLGEEPVEAESNNGEENVWEKEGLVQGSKKRNKKDGDDDFL